MLAIVDQIFATLAVQTANRRIKIDRDSLDFIERCQVSRTLIDAVGGKNGEPERPRTIDTILVPIDFSLTSADALQTAADLAKRFGAAVRLLHVLEEPAFHANSAEAIGDAVLRFFERYPPGTNSEGSREER